MSSPQDANGLQPLTLEMLIALNEEIVALTRAGIPLELGLREFGSDDRGALGRISLELAERMSKGDSLAEAVAAGGNAFPAVYGRVVEAGIRAGRLPAALEAVARFAGDLIDLRRRIALALFYPLLVVTLAYGLFVVVIRELIARLVDTYVSLQIAIPELLRILAALAHVLLVWAWVPPLFFLVAACLWYFSRRARLFGLEGVPWPLTWIPGFKRITSAQRYANFAELTALLVEHRVPLPEAIELAADATGDWAIQHGAHVVAETLMQGGTPAVSTAGLPPFLNWTLARGGSAESLSRSLRLASSLYRDRAEAQVDWLRTTFPIAATVVIGGGTVLLYVLTLFLPFVTMLNDLAASS